MGGNLNRKVIQCTDLSVEYSSGHFFGIHKGTSVVEISRSGAKVDSLELLFA